MKKHFGFVALFCVCSAALAGRYSDVGPAAFTVKILDEDRRPVEGVYVSCGFVNDGPHKEVTGISDSNGFFMAECANVMLNNAGFTAEKTGYYRTHAIFNFKGIVAGRWEPWNPVVTAVVRQIVNPIPMYMKYVETTIPETNQPCGFDLSVGDWVSPLGKGAVGDLVFKVDGYWENHRNNESTLTLGFSCPQDGLTPIEYETVNQMVQGSSFILPRHAPQEGYQSARVWRKSRKQVEGGRDVIVSDKRDGIGYVFRVRSVTNEMGIVTNAYFGKFSSDIEYGGASAKGSYLKFTYYLNPTPNDRNLEFDPKRNLFTNLKPTEQVTSP